MRFPVLATWVLSAVSLAGCAPVSSGLKVLDANVALSAAATAGAKTNAPYEYTAAEEYLRKAREEAGYSDFAASREFADTAIRYAKEARTKAMAVAAAGTPATLPPASASPAPTAVANP